MAIRLWPRGSTVDPDALRDAWIIPLVLCVVGTYVEPPQGAHFWALFRRMARSLRVGAASPSSHSRAIKPMAVPNATDHYEVLQLSPRADQATIQRVFRLLAKRFHPDNHESGDADRFKQVMDAFRVLSNPSRRAEYDAQYEERREMRWRVFDQGTAHDDVAADCRLRDAVLSLLYAARRNDPDQPGLGMLELERLLGCPEQHMKFHIWYLKENGWIQRLESGMLAITASGVDRVLERGEPSNTATPLLTPVRGSHMAASRNGAA